MNITQGVLHLKIDFQNQKEKISQKIEELEDMLKIQNSSDKKYREIKYAINGLKDDLKFLEYFLLKFSCLDENMYIINLRRIVQYIMCSSLNLPEKVECICFMFNVNYVYFSNLENMKEYSKGNNCEKFWQKRKVYLALREIIGENNQVLYLKVSSYEIEQLFESIGLPLEISGVLIDTALKNYENKVNYEERKLNF